MRIREVPLVPAASIAGRALVTVVAIMTFLAALTACTAMFIADAAQGWTHSIAREMTIQVSPVDGHNLDTETAKAAGVARGFPGIAEVKPFTKAQSEALLQPWLGSGLDLSQLPVPRLIVLKLDSGRPLDLAGLRKALNDKVAGASLDDHHFWLRRLAIMADTVVVVAAVIFVLVLIAMVLAVGFATRGAMAGNREIIEVLHFVGAADSYISRQFQRHFFRLGLRGGALGGVLAIVVLFLSGAVSAWLRGTAGGTQAQVMFGSFELGLKGYIAIAVIAGGIAVTTGVVSRVIVFRHLRKLG
ncbi:MAG: ABC transporter permease [Beijerinckiaceae bacterium]|nr:MAG: ABC transporter permease [Beijerinckiaceae bacterium]